ncbi:pyridoxal 5'-phosphate synthase glutaminase subunit PdxT [Acanthopleuribacter pedis]|uniref:glutaminase n=1 Tax=Acanthopleuribacter pedis TaxID=442870 RepID=A0A8J7QAF1_9BACT|nr:pyridoxal 5'-phosphate synthase glutaminase subunit PdxT [Acanthopleuribacter pedis]MBO1320014.1 pyridoxal 5'-phosphate synthase glutaminase subunit PdxT [Acanthopleuribacter pedis]
MIGVLAIQGGFAAHRKTLDRCGVASKEVRLAEALEDCDALILPGGESTTMLKLIQAFDLKPALDQFAASGKAVLGTCAGAILLSQRVTHPEQDSLGWLPADIERNAYGSQVDSFTESQSCPTWNLAEYHALFIRAPRFTNIQGETKVISRLGDQITGVQYRNLTAVTYHPELTDDTRFHRAWLDHCVYSN